MNKHYHPYNTKYRPNQVPRSNLGSITVNLLWSLNYWARGAMMVYCNLMVTTMVDSNEMFVNEAIHQGTDMRHPMCPNAIFSIEKKPRPGWARLSGAEWPRCLGPEIVALSPALDLSYTRDSELSSILEEAKPVLLYAHCY